MTDPLDFLGPALPSFKSVRGPRKKKAKKHAAPEDALHVAVARFLKEGIAPASITNGDGVMWASRELRNAGKPMVTRNGRTINLEGVRRKNVGVRAGFPDVEVFYMGRYHGIELKAEKGRVSEVQEEVHEALRMAGCPVVVAYSLEDVAAALRRWGIPCRARL